ncbi:MAG: PKD domain-containing protein [Bacteroidota bacterium]
MKLKSFITIFSLTFFWMNAQEVVTPPTPPGLTFTENAGQWDNRILCRAGLDGGALFLERDKITYHFYDKYKARQFHLKHIEPGTFIDDQINGHAFSVSFEGCNANSKIEKQNQGIFYENFFINEDKTKWKSNVKNYHQVLYRNLYQNIDYDISTIEGNIKYNFVVKPKGNVSDIRLNYEGIDNIKLHKGKLVIKTAFSEMIEQKPFAYQVINGLKVVVPCEFVLINKTITYKLPKGYNKEFELIIDPLLVFAAQSGSTADNFGMTATFDTQGNLYSGGIIFNIGYPTTPGAYSASFFGPAYSGNTDVVITKYNSSGNALLFSTYLGGNRTETVNSLIVDSNDNLCFFGVTSSTNFPVSSAAYDGTFNGGDTVTFVYNGHRFLNGTDIYVAKFSANGSSLLGCTFIGGSGNDGINQTDSYNFLPIAAVPPATSFVFVPQPRYDSLQFNWGDHCRGEIQLDLQNNIYVTSSTRSANFPTVNSFDNTLGGKQDGVIFKFNSNLTTLLYSSYIGGSSTDSGNGLIIDNNNECFVTGGTTSNDFPHAVGGYQSSYQGGSGDGYIIRISPTGSVVLNGTYFGTSEYDQSYFIQTDRNKNIYIYGQSLGNMPVLAAATATSVFSVPNTHQFISKLDNSLSTLKMSTVFGNNTSDIDISPSAFSIDRCSNIYLSGWGSSIFSPGLLSNMPLLNATQSTTDGTDFYFMSLDSNAAVLKYGSYFGGNISHEHVDGGTSRFDAQGKIYQSVCAGCGGRQDFPVTPGAWPGTPGFNNYSSNCNNGVIKIDFQLLLSVSTINTNTLSGCAPLTVNFTNATPGASFLWYLPSGENSVTINPTETFTNAGIYPVSLVVYSPISCNIKDSITVFISVFPTPTAAFTATIPPCSGLLTTANTSTVIGLSAYNWEWGDGTPISLLTSPTHSYSANGDYTVSLTTTTDEGCSSVATQTISVFDFQPSVSTTTNICFGASTSLNAGGGTTYTWTPTSSLSNSFSPTPTANPTTTTTYSVIIENNTPGYTCAQTLTTSVIVQPLPSVSFDYTNNPCTNSVFAINTSTNAGTINYQWDWGDGSPVSPTILSPNTYSANGSYTLSLVATDLFACSSVATQTISVFDFQPSASASNTICFGASTSLNAAGGITYTWTPNSTLSDPFSPTPTANPTTTTTYSVIIENNTPGYTCSQTLTTSVIVRPQIKANFTYSVGSCNNNVQFTDASFINPISWLWNFESVNTSSIQNPLYYFLSPNSYTVSLIVTNVFGCRDSINKTITLSGFLPISVNASQNKCESDTLQLKATGGISYKWSPAIGLSNPNIANPFCFVKTTTVYSVTISTLFGTDTCKSVLTTTVNVFPFAYNSYTFSISSSSVSIGGSTTFTLNGFPYSGAISIVPSIPITDLGNNSYEIFPLKSQEYTIYFEDAGKCRYALKTIYIELITDICNEGVVYLPTGFTPNNDGVNDLLYIRSNFISEVYLTIFNRWGEKIFETKDIQKGWDGTFKGKLLDQGVYGYYMTFKCNNGEESFKKGNITLMR